MISIHHINYFIFSTGSSFNHPSQFFYGGVQKWGLFPQGSGWRDSRSSIVKHPLTGDYWHAFTGSFRPWKDIPCHNGPSVCRRGRADMNRAPKCITVTRQPVINANKMKGPYQKRQTQTWAVSEDLVWLKSMHLFVLLAGVYTVCVCPHVGLHTFEEEIVGLNTCRCYTFLPTEGSIVNASGLPNRYDIPAENRSKIILHILFYYLT